ncbi:MAG TPA: ASKHA domain-containing protein [Candidatus Polarisedimenticolia bacterium]|nr:ASKHA domain-containing protein [Candidatus Polarisedimenticolia bacterium]
MEPTTATRAEKLKVTFLPKETSTRVPSGTTLFHAAAWTGQPIESTCGGRGTCGKCRVQVIEGSAPITPADQQHLSQDDISAGWRLSCQAEVRDEMVVQVPRLLTTPKTAMFGVGRQVLLDPNVHKVHLRLAEPTLHDQRADYLRLKEALREEGFAMSADLAVLRTLPRALREAEFDVTAVLCGETLVAVEPGESTRECFGIAFDIGTTTIVGTLLDLNNGEVRAVASTLNAQAIHGGDVLSRISYTMGKREGLEELQRLAAFTINGIIEKVTAEAGVAAARVYEIAVAGNLTMMHLLMGIDPEPISVTPFAAAAAHGIDLKARDLGLSIHPEGRVYLFPAIGAYVGGDIVAGLLATAVPRGDKLRLFVDVGTNGEIALGHEQRTVATAAPAGPAFEGAEISCGMRATTGAIEGVQITEDAVVLQTIDDAPPAGLCGSGLVDVVAQLYKRGLLDPSGRLRSADDLRGRVPESLTSRLVSVDGVRAFVLATAAETGDRPVVFTQKDVRQLQFAKGSIASGIKVLMKTMGVRPEDVQEVLLAGAFGSYIHPDAARIIGLVPPVPLDRIRAVGNAAGEGAKIALLSYREREAAEAMPSRVEYIELSGREDFNEIFMGVLGFPPLDSLP